MARRLRAPSGPMLKLNLSLSLLLLLGGCGGGGGGAEGPTNQPAAGAPLAPISPPLQPPAQPPSVPGGDAGQPSQRLQPVAASSSRTENAGLSAAMAIDGSMSTRWASAFEDGAWIQFDFGRPTAIGSMKLFWEAAHGKAYTLQASDDGQNWTPLRHVLQGRGGVESFLNLGVQARYLRLQGVARATQYGYSLFEVEFRTPGSDNTQVELAGSPLPVPEGSAAVQPLPARELQEVLQFSLPDGRLVTRFGARAMGRHGRERGEDWNEIGYGPNETVDPLTGLPVDKGPGAYLNFVPQYFRNRSWGFEIIDDSRVPGVTHPTLIVNQYPQVDFLPGGVAFFRAFDRPGVTGYGWMNPGELVDPQVQICAPQPYPANGLLVSANGINGACTLRIRQYPGHAELGADGFPNGRTVAARALRRGDGIEVAPSMFTTRAALDAIGDSGGVRYYSGEWVYVVGSGLAPWYGVQPRLNSVPLPAVTLSGGAGSVSYNYSDNGREMFMQPHNHTGMQNLQRFLEGRRLIHTDFGNGQHSEAGNDAYAPAVGLQGQRFNQSACVACHVNNGRSPAPATLNQRLDRMSLRAASLDAKGRQLPHPRYGQAVQMNARSTGGEVQDWGNTVRLTGFDTHGVKLADGTVVELRRPRLGFDGPQPAAHSLRAAQPLIGVGLLEAVPEAQILALARSTPDADGVRGQPNRVFDPETGEVRLGRFGWKAGKATLRHQTAAALLQDMAVSSPLYPARACHHGPAACKSATAERGVSEAELDAIAQYLALLAVPAQRSLASGFPQGVAPLDEHRVDPQQVAAGARQFEALRCAACHAAELRTGDGHRFAELRGQTIRPYTNLLLHDMGEGLADDYAEGQASGRLWRTAPLWGIGYTEKVMAQGVAGGSQIGYLHDGRARNLTEAILWHGGEAEASRQRFTQLGKADRDALLAFLRSL